MEKNRMQKLAGLNEGTGFKNGKFKLDRFNVFQNNIGTQKSSVSNTGDWCNSKDVAKLEAIANEMYDILNQLDQDLASGGFGLKSIRRDARAVFDKVKSL